MDAFEVLIGVLRLAEAAVLASPEPLTWQKLQPLLPRDLDPGIGFAALEKRCADRGVVLVNAGGWADISDCPRSGCQAAGNDDGDTSLAARGHGNVGADRTSPAHHPRGNRGDPRRGTG